MDLPLRKPGQIGENAREETAASVAAPPKLFYSHIPVLSIPSTGLLEGLHSVYCLSFLLQHEASARVVLIPFPSGC